MLKDVDYTEYVSRLGRSKLAHLLYEVAKESVKRERISKDGGIGRPRGDAYKLAGEWLGMSKSNFYYLTKDRYATSNAMVNRLIEECSSRRPDETYDILHKDLVESRKLIELELERLSKKFSPILAKDKRDFPRKIKAP